MKADMVLIVRLSQFFALDVVANFTRLSNDDLFTQLKRIIQMADNGAAQALREKIGILTAADRDSWAKNREKLLQGIYLISW